tara:strand:- start:1357 stop:1824 length:468 start_codon:yes stop_codon:yes gene_type:complete
MNSKVIVTQDKQGQVVTPSANAEWGYIRVEQSRVVIDEQNFAKRSTISALIYGKTADLNSFGWAQGTELPGTITVTEQTEPFNPKSSEKDLKRAGDSGVVCMFGDDPIYRKNFYKNDPEAMDATLEHTNGDEIKAAYLATKANAAVSEPNENFDV